MRPHSKLRPITAVLTAALLASCGDEPRPEAVNRGEVVARTALPEAIRQRVAGQPPAVAPELAAGDGKLLVIGGLEFEPGSEPFLYVPREAFIVDVDSGETNAVPAPISDAPIHVLAATADEEGFVVMGQRCEGGGRLAVDDWACSLGSGTAFRMPYDSGGEWEEVPLPGVAMVGVAETFQPIIGSVPTGGTFATVRRGPASLDTKPVEVHLLRGSNWHQLATLPDSRIVGSCASATSVYVLTQSASGGEAEQSTTLTLHEVQIAGGAAAQVELPDVDTSMGGVSVALACDASGPYVTSSKPDLVTPISVWRSRDGEWSRIEGDWTPELVSRFASSPRGVAVVSLVTRQAGALRARVIGARDAQARSLSSEYGDHHFVPDGTGQGFITLGPIARLGLPSENEEQGPIAVGRVDPQGAG